MATIREGFWGSEEEFEKELRRLYEEDGEFWKSLENESDRGMALSAGAYFERFLENCLVTYFDNCKAAADLLTSTAGLKSFQARARCCRALRIIEDDELKTLEAISRIRNTIAHDLMKDFSSSDVRDSVFALLRRLYPDQSQLKLRNEQDAREAFSLSCLVVALDLHRREISVLMHTGEYQDQIPDYVGRNRE
jgi:hypothetical protein